MQAASFTKDLAAELVMLEHGVREERLASGLCSQSSLLLLIFEEIREVAAEVRQKTF